MTTPTYIKAAEGANDEQKLIVEAGNQAIHAVMVIAGYHELCAACFASFVSQILDETSERLIHEDDHDAGHA